MIEVEHKIVITLEITRENARAFRDDLQQITNPTDITRDLQELLTKNVGTKRGSLSMMTEGL